MNAPRPRQFSGSDFRRPEERAAAVAGLRKRLEERKVRFVSAKSLKWLDNGF